MLAATRVGLSESAGALASGGFMPARAGEAGGTHGSRKGRAARVAAAETGQEWSKLYRFGGRGVKK